MGDKLGMSLDQIIQQTSTFSKTKKYPVKADSSERKNFSKFQRKIERSARDSNQFRPVQNRPSQPLKVITKERPRIIRPDSASTATAQHPIQSASNSVSVFSRLGTSGSHVLFKHLNSTVKKEDVMELCHAVGEVRDLSFLSGFDGLGQARVLFANKSLADQCVQKYNGVALDGLEMVVSIDNTHVQKSDTSTSSNQDNPTEKVKPKHPSTSNHDSNIRGGLFGTALNDENKKQKKSTTRTVSYVQSKPSKRS